MLLDHTLSENQLLVLSCLTGHDGKETKSSLVRTLCKTHGLSEPTTRRAVTLFRELGILSCGNRDNPGRVFTLTPLGRNLLGVEEL